MEVARGPVLESAEECAAPTATAEIEIEMNGVVVNRRREAKVKS